MKGTFLDQQQVRVFVSFFFILSLVVSFGLAHAQEAKELVVAGWGGAAEDVQRKVFFAPFEKATGIKIISVAPATASKIKAQVLSKNVEWNLAHAGPGHYVTLSREGLLEKLDYSLITKDILKDIPKEFQLPDAIGYYMWSYIMAYRTDVFPKGKEPQSWKDFWDVKRFPGPRGFHNIGVAGSGLEFALLADGVPKEKLYPLDMERAWRSLDRIKPHILKWWKTGAEPVQLLTDKEVVLTDGWNGRIEVLKNEGVPVEIQWNEGQLWLEYFFIPKGAKNYRETMKCLEFHLQAKNQAEHALGINYGPVNMRAFEYIPPERARGLPSSPENLKKQFVIDNKWHGENMNKVIEDWNNWLLKR